MRKGVDYSESSSSRDFESGVWDSSKRKSNVHNSSDIQRGNFEEINKKNMNKVVMESTKNTKIDRIEGIKIKTQEHELQN